MATLKHAWRGELLNEVNFFRRPSIQFEKLECNRIPVRSSGLGLATGVEDPRIVV